MTRSTAILAAAAMAAALGGPLALSKPAYARGKPQTVGLVKVDP